jgi:hypothetical protein
MVQLHQKGNKGLINGGTGARCVRKTPAHSQHEDNVCRTRSRLKGVGKEVLVFPICFLHPSARPVSLDRIFNTSADREPNPHESSLAGSRHEEASDRALLERSSVRNDA